MASAIEKLPSIDDLLGVSDKAQMDAESLRTMAFNLRRLKELQLDEGLKESDPIPGVASNGSPPRTFKEQYALVQKAWAEKWKRIDAEGHRANVEEILKAAQQPR